MVGLVVVVMLLSVCRPSRHELNELRMQAEELERLIGLWGHNEDAYVRCATLASAMVESLWYCTDTPTFNRAAHGRTTVTHDRERWAEEDRHEPNEDAEE